MKTNKLNGIVEDIKEKLKLLGLLGKIREINYFDFAWKKILDPIFDDWKIHVNERGSISKLAIAKIKNDLTRESKKETSIPEINIEKIEPGAQKVAEADQIIEDVVDGKLSGDEAEDIIIKKDLPVYYHFK